MFPNIKSLFSNNSNSHLPLSYPNSDFEPAIILILGQNGSGKSSFVNLYSDAHGPQSCTDEIQISKPFMLGSRPVILVGIPGFGNHSKRDVDILTLISHYLFNLSPAKVQGIIYLHRITDTGLGGVAQRNFKMFQMLCGADAYRNTAIVTTKWDEVDPHIGIAREEELRSRLTLFKLVLDGGATLSRHTWTMDSAQAIIRRLLNHPSVELLIQKEMVTERKNLPNTSAGLELRNQILKLEEPPPRIRTYTFQRQNLTLRVEPSFVGPSNMAHRDDSQKAYFQHAGPSITSFPSSNLYINGDALLPEITLESGVRSTSTNYHGDMWEVWAESGYSTTLLVVLIVFAAFCYILTYYFIIASYI